MNNSLLKRKQKYWKNRQFFYKFLKENKFVKNRKHIRAAEDQTGKPTFWKELREKRERLRELRRK